MGHIHIGTLSLNREWRTFNALVKDGATDSEALTRELATAANARLTLLRADPNLIYCLWLLMRLASAARRPEVEETLLQLGIELEPSASTTALLTQVSTRLRQEIAAHPGSGPFADLASLSLRSVLHQALRTEQPSLFEQSPVPATTTLRNQLTPTKLGHLVSHFFADFLGRVLRFYVDKTLPRFIGPDYGFATIAESEALVEGLNRYATMLAMSTDYFAGRWFNLHDWTADGVVTREEVGGFVAHAVEKLQQSMLGQELQA
jgi:hypothetical protein